MRQKSVLEAVMNDLYTDKEELLKRYSDVITDAVVRIRAMYEWVIEHPSRRDRDFVEEDMQRHDISQAQAYTDLANVKTIIPQMQSHTKDFYRWKVLNMLEETYSLAKSRKDVRTMERAATSIGKLARIDTDEEMTLPFDRIVVQPFTATTDPSVLGIKKLPDHDRAVAKLLKDLSLDNPDIETVQYEAADLEEYAEYDPTEPAQPTPIELARRDGTDIL